MNMLRKHVPIKDLLRREERIPFYKEIDLLAIEEDLLVGVTGRLAIGFKVQGTDLALYDDAGIQSSLDQLGKFLNHIPEGFFLHFIVRVERNDEVASENYKNRINESGAVARVVLLHKESLWKEKPFTKKEVFLFLGLDPEGFKKRGMFVPSLTTVRSRRMREVHRGAFEKSQRQLRQFEEELYATFSGMGIKLSRMEKSALTSYLFKELNPDYATRIPDAGPLDDGGDLAVLETLRSRLILSVPEVLRESFSLDGFHYRSVNLRRLPDALHLKSLADF